MTRPSVPLRQLAKVFTTRQQHRGDDQRRSSWVDVAKQPTAERYKENVPDLHAKWLKKEQERPALSQPQISRTRDNSHAEGEQRNTLCNRLRHAGKCAIRRVIPHFQRYSEAEELKKLRGDLSECRSEVAELQKRCEAQSRDLQGSNNYLNTADKSSDSDVTRALQRLNAELQQNTTYMADCLVEDFEFENLTTNPTDEQNSVVERVSKHIGQTLAKSLRTNIPEDIPMLLQIALQAYLASALCMAARSWTSDPGNNAFIYGLYQKLRSTEPQAISARWRSLSRLHIHSYTQTESIVDEILTDITDILSATGCTSLRSDITSKLTSMFTERLTLLVKLTQYMGRMFDEVMSGDFEVFLPQPSDEFEDKTMEDVDGGQAETRGASILCATHLGLIKQIPVDTSLWEKSKKQTVTVLKAKVLLDSLDVSETVLDSLEHHL